VHSISYNACTGVDFPALESLRLPKTVHGGFGYEFQLIYDVLSFMHTLHLLLQRTPRLFEQDWLSHAFNWKFSEDSADWYESEDLRFSPPPPFRKQLFLAGSRRGWSWCGKSLYGDVYSCEIKIGLIQSHTVKAVILKVILRV
jgi:hypothetical protein